MQKWNKLFHLNFLFYSNILFLIKRKFCSDFRTFSHFSGKMKNDQITHRHISMCNSKEKYLDRFLELFSDIKSDFPAHRSFR